MFQRIVLEYFDYVKDKWINDLSDSSKKNEIPFLLVILPSSNKVYYIPQVSHINKDISVVKTLDSFGNETISFPGDSTQTAKFLSFNDPAFTINCKTKSAFYQNLSIGENSFKTINIPSDSVMFISGPSWKYNLMLKPEIKNTRKWINDFLSIAHPRLANFTGHFVH